MKYIFILLALTLASAASADTKKPAVTPRRGAENTVTDSAYKKIEWDELVPKNWDPAKPFRELKLETLNDADPRVMKVLEIMKREWGHAPINPEFDGKKVKIPGFVVPLEEQGHAVTEFLLVPYFGACIHVPPPPANQIIHVISAKPIPNLRMMDTVWVAGEMKAARYSTHMPMGLSNAGYQINSIAVTAYKEPGVR